MDKASAYAIALPSDVSATRFEVVEGGQLWRGYAGTVYGCLVCTERGHKFATFAEAYANAEFFVEQCRDIVQQTSAPERPRGS